MVEFYLLTFPRFPLRKKEHRSYFRKNRTHDFRISRCADYLLLIDHSGDEGLRNNNESSVIDVCNSNNSSLNNSNWQFDIFAVTVPMVWRYHGSFNICVVTLDGNGIIHFDLNGNGIIHFFW